MKDSICLKSQKIKVFQKGVGQLDQMLLRGEYIENRRSIYRI